MKSFVLSEVTSPYSFAESFLYDQIIAPAVAAMMDKMAAEWKGTLKDAATVLDVGCGGGQILENLAGQYPQAKFNGVDLSTDQVKRATRRLQPFGERVAIQQGSALELPFADASFDVVYSIASIKHWTDQAKGLRECVRVLKPGGRLLILEVDRACTVRDTESFIQHWKIPRWLRVGGVALFRTWVAGNSLDMLEAQTLAQVLGLRECQVKRIAETPALVLEGMR